MHRALASAHCLHKGLWFTQSVCRHCMHSVASSSILQYAGVSVGIFMSSFDAASIMSYFPCQAIVPFSRSHFHLGLSESHYSYKNGSWLCTPAQHTICFSKLFIESSLVKLLFLPPECPLCPLLPSIHPGVVHDPLSKGWVSHWPQSDPKFSKDQA